MAQSRLERLFVLLLLTVLSLLFGWIISTTDEGIPENATEYKTYFNNCTAEVVSKLTGTYYGNIKMVDSVEEVADIIVSCDSSYKISDTSFKAEIIAYSPIVAAFPENMLGKTDNNNFSTLSNQHNVYFMTDMKTIIEAVIKSEDGTIKLAELGYDSKLEVSLAIPDNGCYYKRDVIDGIIYILSDGKEITEDSAKIIKDKLDILLSKAVEIKNPAEHLVSNKDIITLVPEYIYSAKSGYTIYPVYWDNCYAVPMTIYTNNKISLEDRNGMVTALKTMDSLYSSTKFRNQTRQSKDQKLYYTADNLSVIYGQNNLIELLGDNYWK